MQESDRLTGLEQRKKKGFRDESARKMGAASCREEKSAGLASTVWENLIVRLANPKRSKICKEIGIQMLPTKTDKPQVPTDCSQLGTGGTVSSRLRWRNPQRSQGHQWMREVVCHGSGAESVSARRDRLEWETVGSNNKGRKEDGCAAK